MTKRISLFLVVLAICFSATGQSLAAESYRSDIGGIADLLNRWAYFRDRGMWDQLRTTFWREGTISISWFDGPFEKFVDACIKMDEKDTSKLLKHVIATPFVRINGTRAVSGVNVIIYNRSSIRSLDVDITAVDPIDWTA
jgi:SnoaL-like domain